MVCFQNRNSVVLNQRSGGQRSVDEIAELDRGQPLVNIHHFHAQEFSFNPR